MNKNYLILGTIISGFIVLGLIFAVGNFIDSFISADLNRIQETLTVDCGNGNKIKSSLYWYNIENEAFLIYFENGDKKVLLNDQFNNDLIQNSSTENFSKYLENSSILLFPEQEFLRKKLDYKITEKPNSKYNSTNIAVYINSKTVNQKDFENIISCSKKINSGNFETDQKPKQFSKEIFFAKLNKTFVYNEPIIKFEYFNYPQNIDRKPEIAFNGFVCQNNNHQIFLRMDGSARFYYQKPKPIDKSTKGEPIYYYELSNIGFYENGASFVREKTDKALITGYNPKEEFANSKYLKEVGFTQAYQESQILKLLFNSDQTPKNDYLQTCKNIEGKTLFEIFKQENN